MAKARQNLRKRENQQPDVRRLAILSRRRRIAEERKGESVRLQPVAHRDVKPSNHLSIGFGRDRARKFGHPTPPIGIAPNVLEKQEK